MESIFQSSATLFGLGQKFRAPGTVGTLVTLPFAFLVSLAGPICHMVIAIALMLYAIFACERYERATGTHDMGEVIIDESVGIFIATVWLPQNWIAWGLAFVLFRFFDILKPYPISYLDRNIPGGVGVVIDDVVAGIFASVLLQILIQKEFLPAGLFR